MRLLDYIHQGGPIMYILVVLNIVGLAIIFAKLVIFNRELKSLEHTSDRLAHKILQSGKDKSSFIEVAKQELNIYIHDIERGLNTIKIIASISPLLGLLGTVIGVLLAFKVMSETGLSNPASFASGISMALITTAGGMVVAIPNFIGHSYLLGILDNIEAQLEKSIICKIL